MKIKTWTLNGDLHREDGPAVECIDEVYKEWWLNGSELSEEEFNLQMKKTIKTKYFDTWHNRCKSWYINGNLHREDGPAVECANGDKHWYVNGKRHREDGPAIESAESKWWYKNGNLHREDGPAVECANGTKYWWLDGKKLTEEEFNLQIKSKPIRKKFINRIEWTLNGHLHREDGPAVEWSNGTKSWYINGKRHREDGPAIEWADGDKEWLLNGTRHREDGPALEFANGNKSWYINGKRHREDGPAIEYANGGKYWYINDNLHRVDGPAIEWANGDKYWYINSLFHREDGPAIECANGDKRWYINNKSLSEEEFNLQMKPKPIRTELEDRVEWRLDGKLHREDGPAVEWANGYKEWYINGARHREDGPAIEYANGTKCWYKNGESHREDGPAVEMANGDKNWYINDNLHRVDGPAVEDSDGTKEWYINGELHREDGPAIEWADGEKFWYKNGLLHREDGPAIEDATKQWYLNNKKLTEEEFNFQMKPKLIRTEHEDRVEWRLDGKRHREDGPAIEWSNGNKSWYINGKFHREDGPAIEYANGDKSWYLSGMRSTEEEFNNRIKSDIKKILATSTKNIGDSIAKGVKLEAIERANDKVYEAISQILINQLGASKDRLANPIMKEAILTIIPLALHPVAVAMDGKVPYAKWVKDYSETSIELASKRNVGYAMENLGTMIKMLYKTQQVPSIISTRNFKYKFDLEQAEFETEENIQRMSM